MLVGGHQCYLYNAVTMLHPYGFWHIWHCIQSAVIMLRNTIVTKMQCEPFPLTVSQWLKCDYGPAR